MKHSTTPCHAALILIGGFMLQMIAAGITHSYGVFLAEFIHDFDVSESDAAWAGGIESFIVYGTGIIGLPVINRLGWQASTLLGTVLSVGGLVATSFVQSFYMMYLTYGIITGFGLGLMYFLALFVVENYFEDDMVKACAIVITGFELGLMIYGPLIQFFLDIASWRWAMRAIALTCLPGLIGVVVFKPLKHQDEKDRSTSVPQYEKTIPVKYKAIDETSCLNNAIENTLSETNSSENTSSDSQTLRQRFLKSIKFYVRGDFMLFAAAFLCFEWAYVCPYAFIPLRAQTRGISGRNSSFLLTIFGASGIGARLLLLLIDLNIKGLVISTGCGLFIAGLASLLVPLCRIYATLAIYSAVLGIALGYIISSYYAVVAEMLGKKDKEKSTAGILAWAAFADLLGSPVGGWLIQVSHNYDLPFILSGAIGIGGCVFYGIALAVKRRLWYDLSEESKPIL